MNTPSHFLITGALQRGLKLRSQLQLQHIPRQAVLLGSVAPDIPLWLLSIGGAVYYQSNGKTPGQSFNLMFEHHYFHDPVWIVSHNLLHAPLILLVGLGCTWAGRDRPHSAQNRWFWFLAACLLHAIIDILTHHDDGPLILFPFHWSLRFYSPVSYWDDRHYGRLFGMFELGLNVVCLLYWLRPWHWFSRFGVKKSGS